MRPSSAVNSKTRTSIPAVSSKHASPPAKANMKKKKMSVAATGTMVLNKIQQEQHPNFNGRNNKPPIVVQHSHLNSTSQRTGGSKAIFNYILP